MQGTVSSHVNTLSATDGGLRVGGAQVGATSGQETMVSPPASKVATSGATMKNKSRTSCNLCTGRKKRCDYIEVGGKKQQCT